MGFLVFMCAFLSTILFMDGVYSHLRREIPHSAAIIFGALDVVAAWAVGGVLFAVGLAIHGIITFFFGG